MEHVKNRSSTKTCRTDKSSSRSETVKDISLEDVIAERKILAPASKWQEKNNRGRGDDDLGPWGLRTIGPNAINMSLDAVISQSNAKTSPISPGGGSNIDKSLAEIIGAKNGRGQKREREEDEEDDEEEDNFPTPLEVVEKLTHQDGLIIEQKTVKQSDHGLGRSHNWRATITCGELSGNLFSVENTNWNV